MTVYNCKLQSSYMDRVSELLRREGISDEKVIICNSKS